MNDTESPDEREIARMLGNPEGELGLRIAEKMNTSNQHIIRWTLESLSIVPGNHVMEIGFGNGAHISELLTLATDILYKGVDISDTMITEATARNKRAVETGAVSFINASAESVPIGADTFDKIFTVNTLYFWKSTSKILSEIKRVLKPGGKFCLAIKSRSFMENLPFAKHGFTLYEQSEAEELLEANGFKILNSHYHQEEAVEFNDKSIVPDAIIIVASV